MRILHRDPRTGEVKVLAQSADDLWHLFNIIEKGDIVRATTFRREEGIEGKLRPERMEKKKVRLGIRVEGVEFQEFSDKLRVHGVIAEGEGAGSHHTFVLGKQDDLSKIKPGGWKGYLLERLEEAVALSYSPMITFLAMEYDEAVVAQMHQYGVKEVATIRSGSSGKQFPSEYSKEDFYAEISEKLKLMDLGDALFIVGPGFAKDDFKKFLDSRPLGKKVHVHSSSQGGMTGIQEVLKSGVSKVLEEHRVGFETQLVEELLSEIAAGGPVTFGPEQVKGALEMGAVDRLLVSTELLRDKRFEPILQLAESKRTKIVTISPHHEAGRKLKNMGGVGALLRYKI